MYCHCVFILSVNSVFDYVFIPMLRIRVLCVNKNFLLTYTTTYIIQRLTVLRTDGDDDDEDDDDVH